MHVYRIDTTHRRDVERFVQFPFRLYRDCRQWTPPLVSSARKQLNRQRHPFYSHSEADFFLALQGDEVVGRIAVLEPRKRNSHRGRNGAFFTSFDLVDDAAVAQALFAAAFDWARRRGLDEISGPEGFSAGDGMGVLIKGFKHCPAMGISYNYSYYDSLIQSAGLRKQTDYNSGYLPGDWQLPERFIRVADKIRQRRGFRVLRFRTRNEVRAAAPRIVALYNAAFAHNREFVPLAGADERRITDRMLSMTRPDLVTVVAKDDEFIGFVLSFPDVSAALRRCRGQLYPFGWALLAREARRTRWVNFNGGGVLPQYQGLGINTLLYTEMARILREGQFMHADIVQVNEQNPKMMPEMLAFGAQLYKVHRIYERPVR
jgi:GNAT superfamily N-acetyltransferase